MCFNLPIKAITESEKKIEHTEVCISKLKPYFSFEKSFHF